jgi:hypothetical protein
MTSLRFVGDLPLWVGLSLAAVVAVLSWRYYRRESIDLPHRLRWGLPMLRASAFFLGIMILTGPVVHHRTVIGQLGRVKIYLDASNSMLMQDKHMSSGRKLLICEQLGWLTEGTVDTSQFHLAEELSKARQLLGKAIEEGYPEREMASFLKTYQTLQPKLSQELQEQIQSDVIDPLNAIENIELVDDAQLRASLESCLTIETTVYEAFDKSIQAQLQTGDESLQAALTMFDESTRWQRTEIALLQSSDSIIKQLRERHEVEVLILSGNKAEPIILAADPRTLPTMSLKKDSLFTSLTDLSSGIVATQKTVNALDESEQSPSEPNTAVILVTDGQHNAGPSPLQTSRVLGSQGVGYYTVSTGAERQAPDLAVLSVESPQMVFKEDRVRGVMTVRDQMKPGQPFMAQISHSDEILWQEQLITQNSSQRRIEFEFPIEELVDKLGGQFASDVILHALPLTLNASVTSLPEESETSNNHQQIRLAAITKSYKVLLIDGRSRWETRYLRNAFERDEQWHINAVLAGPGTDQSGLPRGKSEHQFPTDRDSLFEYDLVILGELAPTLMKEHEYEWLREFVEVKGGGIIFIDGQRGKLQEMAKLGLGSLLPVNWLAENIASQPTSLQLTSAGTSESALRLMADEQPNQKFWTELPAPHSLVAVEALEGAEVLMEAVVDGQTYPAMVTRRVGAGRVLYLAFDETWRWRYKAADTWHQRIWNQLAIAIMPRPFAVSDEYLSIDSGPVSYDFGDAVDIRVRLMRLDGKPSVNATVDALIWSKGRVSSTVTLTGDRDVPGIYRGRSDALSEGDYEVSIRASGYSKQAFNARSNFIVLPAESGEMVETAANERLLNQMASSSEGRFLREEEFQRLPELLSPLSSGRVVESETLIWQSYWWFGAMLLLLTAEWILRKRAGLL